jgi:hypothetical protein
MINIHSIFEEFQLKRQEWRRVLEFLLQENVFLKIRLADVLNKQHMNAQFLEIAEQYQNRFIGKDEIIGLIRKDIAEMEKQLVKVRAQDENLLREITLKQNRLQKEITILETTFNELKGEFNLCLAQKNKYV